VTDNPQVRGGLTQSSIVWAFTTFTTGNWHPLTWMSHMLDVTIAGVDPGWHHLTNVLLHVLNASVLLWVLARASGAFWPSALVAFLFALHPLHVESVAWIAERKDVLSTCFGLLTLAVWIAYVRAPRRRLYVVVLLCFAASLMAKPMLVTLPVLLLLLDYWPLARVSRGGAGAGTLSPMALVVEKLPLFALAAVASVVAVVAQREGASVTGVETLPVSVRVAHALVAYVRYLQQALWPVDLAVFYPYPHHVAWTHAVAAGFVLAVITGAAVGAARRAPFVLVGWLWFLVSLLPVIGLVQVGMQSTADRYMYVPLIGLAIAIAWSVAAIAAASRAYRIVIGGLAVASILACAALTTRQLTHWKDDVALYRHALAVTADNFVAQNNLGLALVSQGAEQHAAAKEHFVEALRIRPAYPDAHNNLGGVLYMDGRRAEAIAEFREALRLRPDFTAARDNLRIAESPPR
jgi:hypothetical protein